MARFYGHQCRYCRRAGVKLYLKGTRCFTPKCAVERRPFPPGVHGQTRHKVSAYGVQLREKQKLRQMYGLLERQFQRYFEMAARRTGVTGERLLQLLETRLDNVVYRLGLAASRRQARQLVTHGHILLSGRPTASPSAACRPGDVISVGPKSRNSAIIQQALARTAPRVPAWLQLDSEQFGGRVLSVPQRQEIDTDVREQLVVEYYSR